MYGTHRVVMFHNTSIAILSRLQGGGRERERNWALYVVCLVTENTISTSRYYSVVCNSVLSTYQQISHGCDYKE
jgi:hypothetical protein